MTQTSPPAGLTGDDIATLRHARIFLTTREKIAPVGLEQWDEMVERLSAAPTCPPAPADALGLLRAASEWIGSADHGDNCFVSDNYEGDPGNRCNCGKDSIEEAIDAYLTQAEPRREPAPEPSTCGLTECQGKPRCKKCIACWPTPPADTLPQRKD